MLKDFGKQTNKYEPKLLSAIKCLSSNVMINIIWKWKSTRETQTQIQITLVCF